MVVSLIAERNRLDEQQAINIFYKTKLADKLLDKNTSLYLLSPYLIYELWNAEYQTGDFSNTDYYECLV
ncbi:MAG: hypothetical protein FWD28_00020 [Treponema sp.]|nr:hypothetical protein [Treponema sp.]